jgi:phosphopantothenoylcysteine decarboxylase/phosphopantothenate--cysteine ligase
VRYKKILLAVTGGIAAYKAPELVRLLKKRGYDVKVILSAGGCQFVTKTTLHAVTGQAPYTDDADVRCSSGMAHIELAKWADAILIAPLTANRLAALAMGFADDLLTATCLASTADIYLAPAMNKQMWLHKAVQENISKMVSRGTKILGPGKGEQACGDFGLGRMLEPAELVNMLESPINGLLSGKKILITAGPTREPIDPVRYISNRSSGKMGYAIASAAIDLGADVTLVSGPVSIEPPANVSLFRVTTALEMLDLVMTHIENIDIFICAAAIADFRVKASDNKLKKSFFENNQEMSFLTNPDILHTVAGINNPPYTVGFAAETTEGEFNAKKKLQQKGCDIIALNEVQHDDIGFDVDDNALTVFSNHEKWHFKKQSKNKIAVSLLKLVSEQYNAKN